MITAARFVHRVNPDSTIDSICSRCYETIASSNSETDLIKDEETHICHPLTLRQSQYTDSQRGTF